MNPKEIVSEINFTIKQLIETQTTLKQIEGKKNYALEIISLEKMQESLFSHLIHLQNYLENQEKPSLCCLKKFPQIKKPLKTYKKRKSCSDIR